MFLDLLDECAILSVQEYFILALHLASEGGHRAHRTATVVVFVFDPLVHHHSGLGRHRPRREQQRRVGLVVVEHRRTYACADGRLAVASEAFA